MALDQTRAHEILTWMHAGAAPTALTSTIKARLMTVMGTATANGTELASGGSYVAATGLSIATWAAAASGSQATSAVAAQTNMPASTIVGIELWDSTATPKRVEFGSHTSKVVAAADTLSYASGAITSALA